MNVKAKLKQLSSKKINYETNKNEVYFSTNVSMYLVFCFGLLLYVHVRLMD